MKERVEHVLKEAFAKPILYARGTLGVINVSCLSKAFYFRKWESRDGDFLVIKRRKKINCFTKALEFSSQIPLIFITVICSAIPTTLRHCLVVRIPGSHPGGPGSIPGVGTGFTFCLSFVSKKTKRRSDAGNRTRTFWVKARYPNQ